MQSFAWAELGSGHQEARVMSSKTVEKPVSQVHQAVGRMRVVSRHKTHASATSMISFPTFQMYGHMGTGCLVKTEVGHG